MPTQSTRGASIAPNDPADVRDHDDVIQKRSLGDALNVDNKNSEKHSQDDALFPVTFMTSRAYLVTQLRLYSTFSIRFKVRIELIYIISVLL